MYRFYSKRERKGRQGIGLFPAAQPVWGGGFAGVGVELSI